MRAAALGAVKVASGDVAQAHASPCASGCCVGRILAPRAGAGRGGHREAQRVHAATQRDDARRRPRESPAFPPRRTGTMQKIVAALALTGAAAFVAPVAPAAGTALNGKEEMVALAESNPDLLGRTIGALPSPTDRGVDAGEA